MQQRHSMPSRNHTCGSEHAVSCRYCFQVAWQQHGSTAVGCISEQDVGLQLQHSHTRPWQDAALTEKADMLATCVAGFDYIPHPRRLCVVLACAVLWSGDPCCCSLLLLLPLLMLLPLLLLPATAAAAVL